MTSIVIHLTKSVDGAYVCNDAICDARGIGDTPQAAITAWAADVFQGYHFLMEHIDKLSPELEKHRKDVERFFFPSQEDESTCQP